MNEQAGRRHHQLLTADLRKQLPALYATEDVSTADKRLIVKFFTPLSSWTWYAAEFDGEDTFFGWVDGLEPEWGYFSLAELEGLVTAGIPGVERDLYWEPRTFAELAS